MACGAVNDQKPWNTAFVHFFAVRMRRPAESQPLFDEIKVNAVRTKLPSQKAIASMFVSCQGVSACLTFHI